jgi:hypothetical protein
MLENCPESLLPVPTCLVRQNRQKQGKEERSQSYGGHSLLPTESIWVYPACVILCSVSREKKGLSMQIAPPNMVR